MNNELPPLMLLASVLDGIPVGLKTLYNGHSAGKYNWLTRIGPGGRRTRELWVNVPKLEQWAQARGLPLNIRLKGGIRRH